MSYWKCIKEAPASIAFSENCIYHMDEHGVLFGNNHLTFLPDSCRDGVGWIESHTDIRFERVKRPYRCIKNTGYGFTEGLIYAVDDDGFVENDHGAVFDPDGYDDAIQWLEANTGCRFEEVEDMFYKPGDRVEIVGSAIGESWNPDGRMDKWLGRTMTIDYIENDAYIMKEDNGMWSWFPHMIKGLASFTLSDFRSGDLVKTRHGLWYMYFDGGDMAGFCKHCIDTNTDYYYDDLTTDIGDDRFDIMKVYRPHHMSADIMASFNNVESILDRCDLVFERKEPKKMTVAEVCAALGYEVEIVK